MLVFVSAVADKVTERAMDDTSSLTLPAMALQTVAECEAFLTFLALELPSLVATIKAHSLPCLIAGQVETFG